MATKRYTPEDYLRIAWRWKWALVLFPLVSLTLTSVAAWRLPDRYRSETLILVIPQQVPTDYVKATVTANMQDRLNSISDQILSRTRLEQIVNEFGLYRETRLKRPMEDAIAQMRGDITLEVVKDSFRISYQASDPDVAKRVTERLAAFFIEENLRDREVVASGTSAFLESQLEDARRRLVEREKLIEEFRRNYSGELPSQLQSNLQTIQNKQLQLQTVREGIARDQDRKILLERQLADLTAEPAIAVQPAAPQNPDSADPAVQLETARNTLKALQTRLKDDHPDVIRLKRVIATLESKVANSSASPSAPAETATLSPTIKKRARDLQLEIDNATRQIEFGQREQKSLEDSMAEYQHRVENAPARESQLVALSRDYDTLQNIYRSLLSKREDSKIAENLERRQIGEQFKVVDPARRPERPSSPDRMKIDLGGLAAGLAIAIGLIALFEYRDKSVRTEQDVQRVLRIPVLAVVPDIHTRADRIRTRVWKVASASAGLTVVAACMVVLSHTLRGIR